MKKMFLFKCEIDPDTAINYMMGQGDLNISLEINEHETMTVKESKKIQELMGQCAEIVLDATTRRLNSENAQEEE